MSKWTNDSTQWINESMSSSTSSTQGWSGTATHNITIDDMSTIDLEAITEAFKSWPETKLLEVACFVCGTEYKRSTDDVTKGPNLCALCRQAILMFRQKLIEDMLAEMAE